MQKMEINASKVVHPGLVCRKKNAGPPDKFLYLDIYGNYFPYKNNNSSKLAQIHLENYNFFWKTESWMQVLLFKNRNKSNNNNNNKTTTTTTRPKTITFIHINTPRKPHIYGETINNNQFQYRHTLTTNEMSGSGYRRR
jgi:hypothetical protein